MKFIYLLILLCATMCTHAQVGIGTTTPSNNAALDVTSTNKGIMLPRINDTTNVPNPGAGLLIYNMHTRKPTFHNGTSWSSLVSESATATASNDSLTYTITLAAGGFVNGTYKLYSVSNGMSNPGSSGTPGAVSFSDINLQTGLDINTNGFTRLVSTGATMGSTSMVIEIKFYTAGSATPYFSIKGTNIFVSSFQVGGAGGGLSGFATQISIAPVIIGFKDWINNTSFAWNTVTKVSVTY